MGVVTYKGPTDPADRSTAYRVPVADGDDLVFRIGAPVEDVPAAVESDLKDADGHEFAFGKAASTKAVDELNAEAAEAGGDSD